ncbi:MAG TPA: gephyrin-like molybdotransferase Glp [Terriglobia bacterium]|nr:gephyrin-like molybdotransferase Glp [Terriglobia bacterium]
MSTLDIRMKPDASPVARMLTLQEALSEIESRLTSAGVSPSIETASLDQAWGRVLAEDINADRDYPPFHRSTRDGFAVRSEDVRYAPTSLTLDGEVRAGEHFDGRIEAGHCVAIMTGAPMPSGTDAVTMIEHAHVKEGKVEIERPVEPFENVVRKGSEAKAGRQILARGRRIRAGEIGLLASLGKASVAVYSRPRVAIIPTGDEVVPVDCKPEWYQVRNSNSAMLAAVVASAGGVPLEIGIGPDRKDALRGLIEKGLEADLLLLSGGVSKGKYDLVDDVLEELGADFFLRGIAIRPGKPLVFGRARGKFFFGLPGNPVSSFVTCNLFARPAISVLAGSTFERPLFLRARLVKPVQHRRGLTTFMPARVETRESEPKVSLVGWQGSGDLVGVAEANCFLVLHPDQPSPSVGDWVDLMIMES